jgi:transposase
MRPTGTAPELERRRIRAVELMNQGESPTVIARILGVCRTSPYRWRKMAKAAPEGLTSRPHPGPEVRLAPGQLTQLETLLNQGATKHGWPNALGSAQRVAQMIRRHSGIGYHVEHVRQIVRHRLRWSSQRPQKKARQRDLEKIDH